MEIDDEAEPKKKEKKSSDRKEKRKDKKDKKKGDEKRFKPYWASRRSDLRERAKPVVKVYLEINATRVWFEVSAKQDWGRHATQGFKSLLTIYVRDTN
jgi:hypothetical protein